MTTKSTVIARSERSARQPAQNDSEGKQSRLWTAMASYIAREKQIKGGSRMNKAELISTLNPDWLDLTLEGE